MATDLFELLGLDPNSPEAREALRDARQAERLIDTLVKMRRAQGMTQADVAERMGTTQSSVSKFERAGGDPYLSTIQRYARAIGAQVHLITATRTPDRVPAQWELSETADVAIDGWRPAEGHPQLVQVQPVAAAGGGSR